MEHDVSPAARYCFDHRERFGGKAQPAEFFLIFCGEGLRIERAARRGLRSMVSHHMLPRGAQTWLRPDLLEIARYTKGGGLLGMSSIDYDGQMLHKAVRHLKQGERPDVLTLYFMGVDHRSHRVGEDRDDGEETDSPYRPWALGRESLTHIKVHAGRAFCE